MCAPRTSAGEPDVLWEDDMLADVRAVMLDPYFGSITQCHDLAAADFACFHSNVRAAKVRFPDNAVAQVLHGLASYKSALEHEVAGSEKLDRVFFPMRMFFHEFPGVALHLLGLTEPPEMADVYRAMHPQVPTDLAMATGHSIDVPIPATWLELVAGQRFGACRDTRVAGAVANATAGPDDNPDTSGDIIIGMGNCPSNDTDDDDEFDLMLLGA
jgi:hypothetical protein